jgi:hypothetical protein
MSISVRGLVICSQQYLVLYTMMCVQCSRQCDQQAHFLTNRLPREWPPLVVIVTCLTDLVLIGSV